MKLNVRGLIKLVRPEQWYKNFLIFIPLIFSMKLFNLNYFLSISLGLISLILVSSANYILNDLIDFKRDSLCPDKKNRPLVKKEISRFSAICLFFVLLSMSFLLSYSLNLYFFFDVFLLFLLSTAYTLYFRKIWILDFIFISLNFVLRTVAGSFIIDFNLGEGVIFIIFIFSCFFVVGKRYGEKKILGRNAAKHRLCLKNYSLNQLSYLLIGFALLLIIAFIFFSVSHPEYRLFWAMPFFDIVVLRYLYLLKTRNSILSPDKVIGDLWIIGAGAIFLILGILLIYI